MAMVDIHWSLHMLNSSKGMSVNVSDFTFVLIDVLLSDGGQTRESMRRRHEHSSSVSFVMKNVGTHAFAIWIRQWLTHPVPGDMVDGPIKGFGGLTDDTYMDWILERAKRFFLVSICNMVATWNTD